MTSWSREPLLHFALLAAIVFGVYQWAGPKPTNTTLITVDATVRRETIDKFRSSTQREPTATELDALIEGWVTKEVLYREGLAMGLDRSDGRIREIVIGSMQTLIRTQSVPDAPDENELRRWFEARRAQYDQPPRYDFVQVLFDDALPDGEARAQLASHALAGDGATDELQRQMRSYQQRPHDWVVKTFGEAFAKGLAQQPSGEWRAQRSSRGWHVVRLDAVHPATTATFEPLKNQLEIEWRREREFYLAAQAQRAMRARYTVERSDGP